MSRSICRDGDHEAGFTLIEMLVVLAILALTTALVAPLVSGGSEGARLQSAASLRNMETSLMIDVDRRTFRSTVLSQRSFAPDIDAKLTFASGLGTGGSDGGFQFFPDGSSTGGD